MFHVGQKVVCIKTHSQGVVIKDKVYIVRGNVSPCKCECVDVGVIEQDYKNEYGELYKQERCPNCGMIYKYTRKWYLLSKRFAPITEITSTADIAAEIFNTHEELKEIKIPQYS